MTPRAFLESLPPDRRREVSRLRELIRRHLPEGYEEAVVKKMLVFQVPLARYPDTYNGHPLWYVALGSGKTCLSLHLMPVYADPKLAARLAAGFKSAGKRLDMGKACVRFRTADDLALDAVGEVVGRHTVDAWVAIARSAWTGKRRRA